jgi:hypothetical protein
MRNFRSITYILFILLILKPYFSATVHSAESTLAGLTIQESLRVPVYYAATYGFAPKTLDGYINNPMPFKMEARYIVDKFSSRQNNQLWLNAMLTSNSREELRKIEGALLVFSRLIKTDMYKGDRLVFDLNPVHGTSISINGVALGVIKDLKFQSSLVAIWFGERQPSKKFAEEIRSAPSGKILEEYSALEVQNNQKNRFTTLQTAMNAPNQNNTPSAAEEVKKPSVAAPEIAKASEAIKESVASSVQTDRLKTAKAETTTSDLKTKTPPVASKADDTPVKAEQKPSVAADNIVQSSETKVVQQPANVAENESQDNQLRLASVPKRSVVDQMFDSLSNDYQADLKQYIEQNARPAPPFSVRKKPQGKAQIEVSLAYENKKTIVVDSQLVEGAFDETVTEEFHKSVKRLKSIPPIPEAIADQTITVQVTLDFEKCTRSVSTWICF